MTDPKITAAVGDDSQLKHVVDNALMAAMARSSLDALITIDGAGSILEFGASAEQLFGYSRAEVLGCNVADIVIPPSLRGAHHAGLKHYHATGEGPVLSRRVEVSACRRDGSEFPAELTVVPVEIGGEKLFTAFVRDISERKQYEASLQEANNAKSRFLNSISHELRTPLNTVLGVAGMLDNGGLTTAQRGQLAMIGQAGRALLGMVDQVLDFSRIDIEDAEVRAEEIDLPALLAGVVEAAAQSAVELDIAFHIEADVPSVIVSDQFCLRQALRYLVENAIRYTANGGVAVVVSSVPATGGAMRLHFEVSDTGIDITAEQQQKLHAALSRAADDDSTADGELAEVRAAVRKMCGECGLDSEPGEGSRYWFEISVPWVEPRSTHQPLPKDTEVLLLCDSATLIKTMPERLKNLGASVHCLHTVAALPDMLLQTCTHLLIDIDSQPLAINQLSQRTRDSGILLPPVVGMTRRITPRFANDCDHLVLKPVTDDALLAALRCEASLDPAARTLSQAAPRILLVEDVATNQLIAKAILENAGYAVEIVENGQEALARLDQPAFDLVLMDLRMPVMDGLEATRRLRDRGDACAGLPVIALTANASPEDRARAKAAGVDDFAAKPIDRAALLAMINRQLAERAAANAPGALGN